MFLHTLFQYILYKVTCNIAYAVGSGTLRCSIGGVNQTAFTEGFNTRTSVASSFTSLSFLRDSTNVDVIISNVTAKEVTSADMDVTRTTAATRVDEDGLVNYAEIVSDTELITNGDFSNGTTDWTVSSGTISVDNGRLKIDSVSGTTAEQTVTAIIGKTYKVTYDFTLGTATSGAVIITGGNYPTLNAPEGTNIFYSVATSTSFRVRPRLGSDGTMFVDNISVKEATIDNLPRVDYTDGTSSLLVEPQRTNLITYSEDFTSWNKLAAVVTTNQTTSPSGTLTADKITYDGTTYGRVEQTVAVTNGNTYSWSVYLKNNDLSDVTQVWLGFSLGGQGEFVTITNEWQRYETVQVANGSNEYPRVQFTGTGSLYAWGAQMEEGSYPTSYIKTSGSTVTRNQETYTKTGISDKINSEEGVLFAEMAALSNDGTIRYLSINDGTSNNRVTFLYYSSNTNIRVIVSSGGTNVMDKNSGVSSTLDFHKVAIKWKENDFAFWLDGVKVQTDTSGLAPIGLNTLSFDVAGSGNFFGKVKQLQVFKTALSDSELVTLTT